MVLKNVIYFIMNLELHSNGLLQIWHTEHLNQKNMFDTNPPSMLGNVAQS